MMQSAEWGPDNCCFMSSGWEGFRQAAGGTAKLHKGRFLTNPVNLAQHKPPTSSALFRACVVCVSDKESGCG